MYKNFVNRIWMVLCLVAMLVAVSCASGSPLDMEDEANENQDGSLQELELVFEKAPVVIKGSSDWMDPGISEILKDLMYDMRHNTVETGINVIDPLVYLKSSDNVVEEAAAVDLNSGGADVSFVTYGFRGFPDGKGISRIVVRGDSDAPLFNPGQGVYIGVTDADMGAIRWFGPFGTEHEYTVNLWNFNTVDADNHGYVTIAVYGGDTYTVEELEITVGNPFVMEGFIWEMWDPTDLLGPGGYIHEGIIEPPHPIPPVMEEIPFEM